jgi:hypothetical protein
MWTRVNILFYLRIFNRSHDLYLGNQTFYTRHVLLEIFMVNYQT